MRGFRQIWSASRDLRLFLIFNGFASIAVGVGQVVFNLYLLQLHFEEDSIGALSAIGTVAMALTGLVMGRMLVRYGSWACTFYGIGLLAITSTMMAFVESFWLLSVFAICNGIGLAFLFNTTMPFILDWAEPHHRTQASAVSFSLMSASILIGSIMGGELPKFFGAIGNTSDDSLFAYRWTLMVGGLITLGALLPMWLMGAPREGKNQQRHALVAEPTTKAERQQVRRDMMVFVAIGGCMAIGVGMVGPFYNVYMKGLGATTAELGYIFALAYGAAAVLGLASPAISNRWGALVSVPVLRALTAPFAVMLIFAPSYAVGVASLLIRQVSSSVAWPIEASFIGELLPPKSRAGVFGLRGAAWNTGMAAASFVGGLIIVRYGYQWTFVSLAIFLTASGVLFVGYYRGHPMVREGRIPSGMSAKERNRHQAALATSAEAEPQSFTA